MTSSNNINDHNMAEDISQQTLMVSRCVDSLPPSVILTTETCSLIPKTNSSDILQLALSEVDGYDQNPSQNLQEMEQQHLSDHSYIHAKENNMVSGIVAPESTDIDYITETEMVETLQPKSISFVSAPVSMPNELFRKNSSLATNPMTLSEINVLTNETVGDNEHQTHNSQMASLSIGEQYLNGSNDPAVLPADVVMINSEISQLPPFSLEQYSLQNSILTVSGEMNPETSQLQSLCSNGNLINNSNLLITVKPVSLEQRFLEKVNQQQESIAIATETSSELSLEQPKSNTIGLTETAPVSAPDVTTLFSSEPQTFVETPAPVTTAPVTHIKFLSPPSKQSEKPVGSHENPIKLILHGNAYHPTQRLTKVQLEAILSILKRNSISNVFQNKVQNGCQSVIYDQPTKTRIVCRSLNPKELAGNAGSRPSSNGAMPATFNTARRSQCKRRGRPRKPVPRKSGKEESVCAASEEEREERRGQTTTRSGRVCKPPRPYFKDYMHIPVCDMAKEDEPSEEVDEECHGYSSYTGGDVEEEPKPTRPDPGVTTSKHRKYSCPACSKAYIGQQGLAKHFQLNPKHLKKKEDDNSNIQDDLSNISLASSTISNYSEGNANSQSVLSTCSQTMTSICQVPASTTYHQPPSNVIPQPINHQVVSTADNDSSVCVSGINDHQNRLKELLKGFSDEELYEALLSKFGQSVSLWDFFVKKCSEKPEGAPLISEMLKEFEKFLPEFQRFSHACLSPASFQDPGRILINISNKQVSDALSLQTGDYFASGSDPATSPFPPPPPKQKRLEEDPNHLLDLLHLGLNGASSTTVTPSALSTGCLPAVPFDPVARGENGGSSSFLEMEGLVGGMEGTGCLTEIVTPVNHPIILDQGALLEGNGEYEVLHQGERFCLLVSNGQSVLHRLSAPPDFHPNIQQNDQVPHNQLPDL